MKKLLTLVVLVAGVALLAGCVSKPAVTEETVDATVPTVEATTTEVVPAEATTEVATGTEEVVPTATAE